MTNNDLKKVLRGIQLIPNEPQREEVTRIVLKAAAESITLETLKQVTNAKQRTTIDDKTHETLKFSKAEIKKLPPALQKLLEKCGRSVACRTTEHGLYQARFRKNGYRIEVADKNFSALKEKFLQKLIATENKKRQSDFPLFKEYAEEWLSVKSRVLKQTTYAGYEFLVRRKLISKFGDFSLNSLSRQEIQSFLFSFSDAKKYRTAHKLKTLLSAIFSVAAEKTRKGKTDVLRKIPLSPMLKKVWYLIDFERAILTSAESIRRTLKQIYPDRHPHELRYTFITRAKECGCHPEAVMLWAGHSHDSAVLSSAVDRGYTTFSDEFLLNEMKKFAY